MGLKMGYGGVDSRLVVVGRYEMHEIAMTNGYGGGSGEG